ncbi:GMC oxidoreductase-domain-containing protein, partial [Mycena galericulata]
DDHRAVGVEYTRGEDKEITAAYASSFIILSAGALCSPAILERSGIGSKNLMQEYNIPLVSELPGVGENYQDHTLGLAPYHSPEGEVTLNALVTDKDAAAAHEAEWLATGKGLLASKSVVSDLFETLSDQFPRHSGIDAAIRIRPNAQDLEELGPVFQTRWNDFFSTAPDKPIACIGSYLGINPASALRPAFTMTHIIMYPAASGNVHIQSSDPFKPLKVNSGILKSDEDVTVLRWAYKWSRELARRMDGYRGEFLLEHPAFPEGSQAKCGEVSRPVEISAPEIKYDSWIFWLVLETYIYPRYTKADDDAIDAFHRANITMAFHALGTCAMKPRDQGGVVDSRLNVYGVTGLKVADMSVAPLNVGANTYNTALIIGEKAALVIAEELGIQGAEKARNPNRVRNPSFLLADLYPAFSGTRDVGKAGTDGWVDDDCTAVRATTRGSTHAWRSGERPSSLHQASEFAAMQRMRLNVR